MVFSHGFSHVSRVFARFSHELLFEGFFRTNFRTFRTVSHDFRTTCFFKVFLLARIFARFARFRTIFARSAFSKFFARTFRACSQDLRTQAVGQRVCARFDRNQHNSTNLEKITRFDWRTPKFLNFYKERP